MSNSFEGYVGEPADFSSANTRQTAGSAGLNNRSVNAVPIQAKQDSTKPRIIDVNTAFILRTAQAMTVGHAKYEQDLPIGDKNYQRADLKFALGRVNNLILHAMRLRDYYLAALKASRDGCDRPVPLEDDLGHAAANLNMLAWWEEAGVLPNSGPAEVVNVAEIEAQTKRIKL